MKIAAKTDIGFRRSENQDRYIAGRLQNGCAFAFVCDGMGGVSGGKIASEAIAQNLEEGLFLNNANTVMDAEKEVLQAIDRANKQIYYQGSKDETLKGMGSTVSGVTIMGTTCVVYNVGDSRVYILRKEVLTQITEDHSVVQELYRQGKITQQQLENHPQKNLITRAIGVNENIEVDVSEVELQPGDTILCASDGLTNFVQEIDIKKILSGEDVFSMPQKLVDKALENNASDNITAIVIHV